MMRINADRGICTMTDNDDNHADNERERSMLTDARAREELYRRATEKWQQLKKSQTETWADYDAIGEALVEVQREIMRANNLNAPAGPGYQKSIKAWLTARKLNDMDKGVRSRLIELTKHRSEVQEMMAEWSLNHRMEWNHP